jgi:hypothetical protein
MHSSTRSLHCACGSLKTVSAIMHRAVIRGEQCIGRLQAVRGTCDNIPVSVGHGSSPQWLVVSTWANSTSICMKAFPSLICLFRRPKRDKQRSDTYVATSWKAPDFEKHSRSNFNATVARDGWGPFFFGYGLIGLNKEKRSRSFELLESSFNLFTKLSQY